MHEQGGTGDGEHLGDFWWASLAARLLHPVQLQIIEALRWTGQPLSARDFAQLFNGEPTWVSLGHHLRRLTRLDAVELAERPTRRNVMGIRFRLVVKRESDGL